MPTAGRATYSVGWGLCGWSEQCVSCCLITQTDRRGWVKVAIVVVVVVVVVVIVSGVSCWVDKRVWVFFGSA